MSTKIKKNDPDWIKGKSAKLMHLMVVDRIVGQQLNTLWTIEKLTTMLTVIDPDIHVHIPQLTNSALAKKAKKECTVSKLLSSATTEITVEFTLLPGIQKYFGCTADSIAKSLKMLNRVMTFDVSAQAMLWFKDVKGIPSQSNEEYEEEEDNNFKIDIETEAHVSRFGRVRIITHVE